MCEGEGTARALDGNAPAAAAPGFYCDGHGLNLRVDPSGARQWVQRLVIRGRPRMLGLGGYPLVSLAEARNVAFANRQRARTGGDPRAEKRHGQGVPTVEEAAAAVLAQQRPGWRNAKHARDWPRSLRAYAVPRIGALPVSAVTTADVLAILTPIWHDKPETARRVRQRIGAVMKWAVTMGLPPLRGKLFLSSSLERCPSHVPHTVPNKMNGTA